MSFYFEVGETISLGVRRILNEVVEQILQDLTDPEKDRDEGVHDARKNCKRVRAVYRLIRDEIGNTKYREENIRFRDTARLLAGARDSLVLIETLDKLFDTYSDKLALYSYKDFRQYLVDEYQSTLTNDFDHYQTISSIQKSMQNACIQISNLSIGNEDFSAIQGGMQRTYRRCLRAMNMAQVQPGSDVFHEWRKRVKYLWHQVEILGPIQPEILTEQANELHTLSDYLGDDHDLDVLRKRIMTAPSCSDEGSDLLLFVQIIDQERLVLEENALTLGDQLFSVTPKNFVRCMESYWRAWESENVS